MGLSSLPVICNELIAHGMKAHMPIALIEQGTTVNHRVITGTLETLPEIVTRAGATSPSLIVVGEVVRLYDSLAWFRPHEGQAQAVFPNQRRKDAQEVNPDVAVA